AVWVTQRRSVKGRGDDLPARALRSQPGVAGDVPRHNFPQRLRELPCLLGADESRQRLLKELVWTETEECGDGVVGLQDLSLEIRNEHGVRRVLDQSLGVGMRLVQPTHVSLPSTQLDGSAVWVTQRRSVKGRGDNLPA